jgi:DNA-binding FrmR family transcriptional regulator
MSHTVHNRKALLARIRRIQGQVGGMETTLNVNPDCAVVLQQDLGQIFSELGSYLK